MNENNDKKVLEEFINRCKECKFATCEQCEINWKQVQAIENLIKEYKKIEKQIDLEWVENNYIEKSKYNELVKKNKELEEENNLIDEQVIAMNVALLESIPKSKVREKIEEIDEILALEPVGNKLEELLTKRKTYIEILQEGDKDATKM